MWRIPTFIALGTLLTIIGTTLYVRTLPEYSVYWFQQALETRNPQAFDLCVDVDAVALDLARQKISSLPRHPAYVADAHARPDPETAALLPEMRTYYKRYLRTSLLGLNFLEPVDHRYLKTPLIRTGDVVETTMTPDIRAHRPWQVRFLKQDGGLWKVVAIHRETAQN